MLRSSPTICLLLLSFTGLAVLGCGGHSPAGDGHGGSGGGAAGAAGKGGASGTAGAAGKGGATGTGGANGDASGTAGEDGGANGGASGAGGATDGGSGTGGGNGGAAGTAGAAGGAGKGGASGSAGASGTAGAAGNGGATGTAGAGGSSAGGSAGSAGAAGTSGGTSGGSAGAAGQGAAGVGGGGAGGAGASGNGGAAGTSACGPCNAPPTDCYALTGTCVQGACSYAFIEGAECDDGNPCTVNDTCAAGACTGSPMACTTPRAPVCTDGTHLQTYDNPGVCNGGRCVYTQETVTCGSGGCANGACQTDPCANVTCNSPPSACYDAAGTCSAGSCSYPPNHASCDDGNACTDGDTCSGGVCSGVPKLCNTPDPDTCKDTSTAAVHDHVGTCAGGTCSYAVHYVSCPTGCTGGACNSTGWTQMTSNSNQTLNSVWGTSATSVWAVGNGGTALYYDGLHWQSRPTPSQVQQDALTSLSGTSDSNIFAVGTSTFSSGLGTDVIRFDGTSWSFLANVPVGGQYRAACVAAYADNDAFVWGYVLSNGYEDGVLYRVTGGVANQIMGAASLGFSNQTQCGIHVFSPSNIVATGNQQAFQMDSGAHTATTLGTAIVNQGGALWADATNDIFITSAANAERWTTGPTWANLTTGLSGSLLAISGTSSSRVFAAGQANLPGTSAGTVLYWDGVGWTVQTIPAVTTRLLGIWASPLPAGRVFAVGPMGTILTGP
jgi:hypothetical protein